LHKFQVVSSLLAARSLAVCVCSSALCTADAEILIWGFWGFAFMSQDPVECSCRHADSIAALEGDAVQKALVCIY
jgi:hypothetical protein